jgi:hypothetical protein
MSRLEPPTGCDPSAWGLGETELLLTAQYAPRTLHRRRWEDNIKVNPEEVEVNGAELHFAQDMNPWRALVNKVMKYRVHKRRRISWLHERFFILGFHWG